MFSAQPLGDRDSLWREGTEVELPVPCMLELGEKMTDSLDSFLLSDEQKWNTCLHFGETESDLAGVFGA